MIYVDYTTLTKVDPNEFWSIPTGDDNHLDATALTRGDDSYLYKDY